MLLGILAHETWFTDERPPYDWAFARAGASLLLIGAAVAVAAVWRLLGRRVPRPELPFLGPLGALSPWVPRLLAIHAGVSLLAQAARATYLAPALHLPDGPLGAGLRILEGVLGVWLISGFRIRWAAFAVVASGPLGMPSYGVVPILERMDLLGIALFLALLPPGPDRWGAAPAAPGAVGPAIVALRVLVGGALVVLAFTEKLARPELGLAFLERFPAFNLLRTLGLDVGDVAFVRIAGAVELLFGLLLISGTLPQLAVIAAGIPFNATLFFLGAEELIGHLPIYGAMLALLVYGSDRRLVAVVDAFPRPGAGAAVAARAPAAAGDRSPR
ncbi:MAG TPA: hypothetical protein VNO17_05050 [Actinomycetota bacterium]|nr:hypothetical protein [Actinomycetota bacterium]